MRGIQWVVAAAIFVAGFFAGAWWTAHEPIASADAARANVTARRASSSEAPALPVAAPQPGAERSDADGLQSSPTVAASTSSGDAPTRAQPVKHMPPEIAEFIGRLKATSRDFEAQKRDDAWAGAQEARLRQYFEAARAALPPGARLVEVDCRTTMCALSIEDFPENASPDSRTFQRFSPFNDLLQSNRYGIDLIESPGAQVGGGATLTRLVVRPDVQFVQPGERGN